MHARRPQRRLALAATIISLAAGIAAAPAAAAPVETIVQDDALMLHGSDVEIRRGMERARDLGIVHVRLTAGWSVLAPQPDSAQRPEFDATDPAAYPADNWRNLDRAVRIAHDVGLRPMIDIAFWAPRWATKDAAQTPDRLATEIDARHFADFAQAVARRYSGSWTAPSDAPPSSPSGGEAPDRTLLDELFGRPEAEHQPPEDPEPPAGTTPLPAVDTFTLWNEPNHPGFLRPQWQQVEGAWVPRAAEIYRDMVRLGYPAVKEAAPHSRVLIGATASMGSSRPGVSGIPPLRFLRALACVDDNLRPVTAGTCEGYRPLPGDGWSHHPYSLRTTPEVDTMDRDKAPVAATVRLAATLRALVAAGRLAPAVADLYLTEYGYETNAPDPQAPFSLEEQGALLAWAEYIATREPSVRTWPQFQLYDRPDEAPRPGMRAYGDWHSGLYFNNGEPKPAAATYATPIHVGCVEGSGGRWGVVWGRLRGGNGTATATIEVRRDAGAWQRATSFERPKRRAGKESSVDARDGAAITRYVALAAGVEYRLRWASPEGERTSRSAAPIGRDCVTDGRAGARAAGRAARACAAARRKAKRANARPEARLTARRVCRRARAGR